MRTNCRTPRNVTKHARDLSPETLAEFKYRTSYPYVLPSWAYKKKGVSSAYKGCE
jgi:hypothetical protein